VTLATAAGDLHARTAIVTVSTSVLAERTLSLPAQLEPWRAAAARLPLGRNEKVFLRIAGENVFEPDTHVFGDLRDAATGSYLIRPYGWPIIECYLGGAGADFLGEKGPEAGFARAADQLASLFGADIRKALRPLAATNWSGTRHIGGAYSSALPGQAEARRRLARSFDGRMFFAGEATHRSDFSTAHGAYATGWRAAEEAVAALAPAGRPLDVTNR
jgi:monoamine oxidase